MTAWNWFMLAIDFNTLVFAFLVSRPGFDKIVRRELEK